MSKRWDIFCRIVDNFGDIGVCWRLAKQLHVEHDVNIRLWVDDVATARRLIPTLDLAAGTQVHAGVTIATWQPDTQFDTAADVVIEAFSCELPPAYLQHMHAKTVWVNLEYLSAEPWVAEFHGKFSIKGALNRHFFFPGFGSNTGGLIREQKMPLIGREQADDDMLHVSLFCYPHAPITTLLDAMSASQVPMVCYFPMSSAAPKIAAYFGVTQIEVGKTYQHKQLTLQVLPFLSQDDYDALLAGCDLNFVRGEDSWVRAIWAGKSFVWQPYQQEEHTHIPKLDAFLHAFYADALPIVYAIHHAWVEDDASQVDVFQAAWQDYFAQLPQIKTVTKQKAQQLAAIPDLATNLVIFIENLSETHV